MKAPAGLCYDRAEKQLGVATDPGKRVCVERIPTMCRMRILLHGSDVQNRCHDLRSLHESLSRVGMEGGSVHLLVVPC